MTVLSVLIVATIFLTNFVSAQSVNLALAGTPNFVRSAGGDNTCGGCSYGVGWRENPAYLNDNDISNPVGTCISILGGTYSGSYTATIDLSETVNEINTVEYVAWGSAVFQSGTMTTSVYYSGSWYNIDSRSITLGGGSPNPQTISINGLWNNVERVRIYTTLQAAEYYCVQNYIYEIRAYGSACGDGSTDGSEACDDSNNNNCDGCRWDCSRTDDVCGDGIPECFEECDDGNNINTDACPDGVGGTCQNAYCGDGFVRSGVEGCDDGNSINTDACPDGVGGTCQPAECGDGFVQSGVEECDDGGTVDGDGCSATCTIELGDTDPPVVSVDFSGPNANPYDIAAGEDFTITATATDNVGVTQIDIYEDSSGSMQLVQTCASSPCSWTRVGGFSAGFAEGFYAEARDAVGNVGRDPAAGYKNVIICAVDGVTLWPSADCAGGVCEVGDNVDIAGNALGHTCPSTFKIYVEAEEAGGTCHLEEVNSGHPASEYMQGMTITCNAAFCSGQWQVPNIPLDCQNDAISGTTGYLMSDDPPASWRTYDSMSPSGSFQLGVTLVPVLTSIAANPQYVGNGDAITITSVATTPADQILLECGTASDTEGDGYADDGLICTGVVAASNPSCTFNSPWTDSMRHDLYCRARNSVTSAYSNDERTGFVYSDNTAPVVTWNSPTAPSYFKDGDSIIISADISDPDLDDGNPGSGITNGVRCEPLIGGLSDSFVETTPVTYTATTATTGTCSGVLQLKTPSNLREGNSMLVLLIADSLGNGEIVGNWSFNDLAGDTASDSSANGNDGTLTPSGTGPTWRSGNDCISGSCLEFDGVDDRVVIADSDELDIIDGLTISLWLKPKAEHGGYAVHPFDKWTATTNANYVLYYFGTTSGLNREIGFYANRGGSWNTISDRYQTSVDEWYHVVLSRTSATGGRLYVNGVPRGGLRGPGDLMTNSINLEIGNMASVIDEVSIYAHAVNPTTIFIDNTQPTCMPYQPGVLVGSTYWSTGTFNLTWLGSDISASGPGSGMDHYNVSYSPPSGNWYDAYASGFFIASTQPNCTTIGTSSWNCTLRLGDPVSLNHLDYYDFRCNATDMAVNEGPTSAPAVTTRIDDLPPNTVLLNPLGLWANSSVLTSVVVDIQWNSTDGTAAVPDSGVDCSYLKVQRCNHKASPGVTDCSDWGEWMYIYDYLNGELSECISPTLCTGGECHESFLFNGSGISVSTGLPVERPIEQLDIYNFSTWASDRAGNNETHDPMDPIIDLTKPKYNLMATIERDDGTFFDVYDTTVVSIDQIENVQIKSDMWDEISGIDVGMIEYTILTETGSVFSTEQSVNGELFCIWDGTGVPPACVNNTVTPWIPYTDDTIYIRFSVWARDKAGNVNSSLVEMGHFYLTTNPLTNFKTRRIHMTLGQSYDLAVQVRNLQPNADTVTIDLSNYNRACFLNSTQAKKISCQQMEIGMNPFDEKTVFVRVMSDDVSNTPYTLRLDATSSLPIVPPVSDTVKISVGYPTSFPGLSEWAALVLVVLSIIIYLKSGTGKNHLNIIEGSRMIRSRT
jgi:cysteine-rich repeat protein